MSFRIGRGPAAAVVLGGCLAASVPAMAGFTTVNALPPGEKSIKEILDHVYGGSFVANGVNYSNGPLTASRINDTPEPGARGPLQPLNLIYDPNVLYTGLMPTDQVWEADSVKCQGRSALCRFHAGVRLR